MYNDQMEAFLLMVAKVLASKTVLLTAMTGVTIALLSHLKALKFRHRGRHYGR
jgi:hypothetical protein